MKKLVIAATMLALTAGVNAQTADNSAKGIGNIAPQTWAAWGVSLAVATAIVSNSRGTNIKVTDIEEEVVLVCNPGDGSPVNGICTNNSTTVTVTGSGTNTYTTTVPVVTTYLAIEQ